MPPPAFRVAITPKPFVGRPREYEVFSLGSSYFRQGSQKTFLDALSFINKHIIASLGEGDVEIRFHHNLEEKFIQWDSVVCEELDAPDDACQPSAWFVIPRKDYLSYTSGPDAEIQESVPSSQAHGMAPDGCGLPASSITTFHYDIKAAGAGPTSSWDPPIVNPATPSPAAAGIDEKPPSSLLPAVPAAGRGAPSDGNDTSQADSDQNKTAASTRHALHEGAGDGGLRGSEVLPQGGAKGPAPAVEAAPSSSGQQAGAQALGHHKVFISHAGEQKRGFVSFLQVELERRCEVPVFLDELSLQPGHHGWSNIVHALKNAAVVVVVLSKEYIQKPYPMEELQLLLDAMQKPEDTPSASATNLGHVLPVWYLKESELQEAISKFCAPGQPDMHQRWGAALQSIYKITAVRDDQAVLHTDLVQLVAKEVEALLLQLNQLPDSRRGPWVELPATMVGMDSFRDMVLERIKHDNVVLLHGMGGIGKTTCAKAVYQHLRTKTFRQHRCYFAQLQPGTDVTAEQAKLLSYVLGKPITVTSRDHGISMLRHFLSIVTMMLIVVDNVWGSQLTEFLPEDLMTVLAAGSRLLVTSRYETATKKFISPALLKVPFLSTTEARELLCKHAFGCGAPSDEKQAALVDSIVSRCGNLPQALEVAGKLLDQGEDWGDIPRALLKAFNEMEADRHDGYNILYAAYKVSMDRLEGAQKELLLDIAFYFVGQPWGAVNAYAGYNYNLEDLKRCALVTKEPCDGWLDDAVGMHDTMVEFCCKKMIPASAYLRDDAAIDDVRDLAKDIQVLAAKGGSTKTKLLPYEQDPRRAKLQRAFQALSWLEVLGASGGTSNPADPAYLWQQILSAADVTASESKQPLRLTTLSVLSLHDLPDAVLHLAHLDLSNVKYVSLRGLPKLESLPTSKMRAVRHLEVHGGSAISSIDLQDLSGLTTLDLVGCSSLTHMPGLGQLAALERLYLTFIHELDLPDLSGMTSLKEFHLHDCCSSLTVLSGLQRLKALVSFNINTHLSLQHLGGAEHLISLRTLLIMNCPALKAVPNLASCTKLQHIKLSLCKQIRELLALQEVACLQELVLEGLPALQQKQLNLAKMKYLELLSIRDCGGLSDMPDLSSMTRLHKFTSNGLAGSNLFPAEGLVRRLHTFCTQNDLGQHRGELGPEDKALQKSVWTAAGLVWLAMLQHLTVQQCFERMSGAMEDFTYIDFADFSESGVKQIQDRMQRLKVLQLLVVENAGKLRELPDLASVPSAPSGASVHSCLTPTPDKTVVVPDELVFFTCKQRNVTIQHFLRLVAIMPPAQAQLCALALLQYRHVHHEGDERGLETVSHLEELAALFAGTGLGASIITAEHLLSVLWPPVNTDEDDEHEGGSDGEQGRGLAESDGEQGRGLAESDGEAEEVVEGMEMLQVGGWVDVTQEQAEQTGDEDDDVNSGSVQPLLVRGGPMYPISDGADMVSEQCVVLHLPRGSAAVERVEVDVTACDQGWADAGREEHGTYQLYRGSSGTCAVLDAATEEVLSSDMVYSTRIALPLLQTYRVVFLSSGGLVQTINRNLGSRDMKIVLLVNARHLRWANYVADASIACYRKSTDS